MSNQSKYEHEIESFKEAFADKKDKKIAIYGTGRMTATLLSAQLDYDIIGLLDRDSSIVGTKMYGVKVIDLSTAEAEADIIIINTVETYWNTIFNRIKTCKVPIYFRNGELAVERKSDYENNSYWNTSIEELKREIRESDVVSFDIFGTLVGRRIYSEIDVFRLVEDKVARTKNVAGFVEYRKKASISFLNPNIDEIYEEIQRLSGWDESLVDELKREEIELDKRLIYARNDMIELCKMAIPEKEVYLVSDMYYTKDILWGILQSVGLEIQMERIIVSCDLRKSKEEGTLWDYYANQIVCGRNALHIGDNMKSDKLNAQMRGIKTFYVMNASDMLKDSAIEEIESYVVTPYSSLLVGVIASKMFNSPFALNKGKGKINFSNPEEIGFCLLGSIALSFSCFIYHNTQNEAVDDVLFFGREGYLLVEIYNYFLELIESQKLKGRYLEISRRAIMNASVESFDDVFVIAQFPYNGTLSEFLKDRFNVYFDEKICEDRPFAEIQADHALLIDVLKKYENAILDQVGKERRAYTKYLEEMCLGSNVAVVDSWFQGSIQFYLGKLLKKRLLGLYFCVMKEKNAFSETQTMRSCFQKEEDKLAQEVFLYKYVNFVESFFTAPNGMLEYMDVNGKPIYQEKKSNQEFFDIRYKMLDGIKDFIRVMVEYRDINDYIQSGCDDIFADKLFGVLMNEGFVPSDEMKKSFYYDNGLMGQLELPIWG